MINMDISNQYDAYLIMIGVAYIKMSETDSLSKKEAYQGVINALMREVADIDNPENYNN